MLSADDIRQLQRLSLADASAASAAGSRVSRARGHGLEFKDYRPYLPGDDPRSIDWTVDARLRQLVVRVSQAEGQTRLHLLLDASGSMAIGVPSKLSTAARLAAALAYVAVERRDPVGMTVLAERITISTPPAAGRRQLFRVLETITHLKAEGRTPLNEPLLAYGGLARGPGLAVVLSDFLVPEPPTEGLSFLIYRGLTPVVMQVLADEDVDPAIDEEVELRDSEDPDAPPVIVNASAIAAYQARLRQSTARLHDFCRHQQIPFVQLRASTTFDAALAALRDAGLVAAHA